MKKEGIGIIGLIIVILGIALIGRSIHINNPFYGANIKAVVGIDDLVYPGDTVTHTFTLTQNSGMDLPDSEYSDGIVVNLYKSYAVFDESGNILVTDTEEIKDIVTDGSEVSYTVSYDVPMDAKEGDYVIGALLFSIEQDFDRSMNTWSQQDPNIIDKQGVKFTVVNRALPPEPEIPNLLETIKNIFASIWCFFKGLFGGSC